MKSQANSPAGVAALILLILIGAAIAGGGMPGQGKGVKDSNTRQNEVNNNYGCGPNGIQPDVNGHCP